MRCAPYRYSPKYLDHKVGTGDLPDGCDAHLAKISLDETLYLRAEESWWTQAPQRHLGVSLKRNFSSCLPACLVYPSAQLMWRCPRALLSLLGYWCKVNQLPTQTKPNTDTAALAMNSRAGGYLHCRLPVGAGGKQERPSPTLHIPAQLNRNQPDPTQPSPTNPIQPNPTTSLWGRASLPPVLLAIVPFTYNTGRRFH